jgi:aryl-alcohol dehydrogenase-like predicted oxidoreductase
VNNLCLGTVQLGLNYGISNQTGKPEFGEVLNIIQIADQHGIVFYDTAQAYGESENILGKAFEELNIQKKVKVISKLEPSYRHSNHKKLKHAIQDSLDKLGVESLWGLMTHRNDSVSNWKAFEKDLKIINDQKLVENIGVSTYAPEDALAAVKSGVIDIIQIPFNIIDDRLIQNGFFDIARNSRIRVFVRSLYLQGLLLMDRSALRRKGMGWAVDYLQFYYNFLTKHKLQPQHFALKAIAQQFPEVIIVTGVEKHSQLLQNIKLLNSSAVSSDIISEWWRTIPELPEFLLNPSKWSEQCLKIQ